MSTVFKKAVRESLPTITIVSGGTGSGKSFSSLALAKGLSGGKRFAVIDSERGRAKHYSDYFDFDHADIGPPFRPDSYLEAIMAADAAGYPAIVVDQFSSEWAGEGGCLDWHEEIVEKMAKGDWKRRESCNLLAWAEVKQSHKKLVQKLLQVRAHLVLALRAEEKVEIVKEDGKTRVIAKQTLTGLSGWCPISEKNLPFEATCSFLLTADAPGIPKPIKLQAHHRPFFDLTKPITEEAGRQLAEWAAGGVAKSPLDRLTDASKQGSAALLDAWNGLNKAQKVDARPSMDALKAAAAAVDAAAASPTPPPAPASPGANGEAGAASAGESYEVLYARLSACSTLDGVSRVEAQSAHLPPDQRAKFAAEVAKHREFM